jgi:hypothetical protein
MAIKRRVIFSQKEYLEHMSVIDKQLFCEYRMRSFAVHEWDKYEKQVSLWDSIFDHRYTAPIYKCRHCGKIEGVTNDD